MRTPHMRTLLLYKNHLSKKNRICGCCPPTFNNSPTDKFNYLMIDVHSFHSILLQRSGVFDQKIKIKIIKKKAQSGAIFFFLNVGKKKSGQMIFSVKDKKAVSVVRNLLLWIWQITFFFHQLFCGLIILHGLALLVEIAVGSCLLC